MESLASLFTSVGTYASAPALGISTTGMTLPAATTGATVAGGAALPASFVPVSGAAGTAAATAAGAATTAGLTAAEIANLGATGLQIAGTAVQTSAAADQAREQARQGEAQAGIIETETEFARRAERLQNKRILARNRVVAGASGVDPFSGSPLEMELANAFEGSLNEQLIGYAGGLRARNARMGAAFTRRTIPGIYTGGALRAGSTALGDMYRLYNPSPYARPSRGRGLYNP